MHAAFILYFHVCVREGLNSCNIDWTQAVFKVQDGRYSCIGRYNSLEVFMPYWNLEQTIKGYNPKPLQKVRGVGLDAICFLAVAWQCLYIC